jgi:hypothetical protein
VKETAVVNFSALFQNCTEQRETTNFTADYLQSRHLTHMKQQYQLRNIQREPVARKQNIAQ